MNASESLGEKQPDSDTCSHLPAVRCEFVEILFEHLCAPIFYALKNFVLFATDNSGCIGFMQDE